MMETAHRARGRIPATHDSLPVSCLLRFSKAHHPLSRPGFQSLLQLLQHSKQTPIHTNWNPLILCAMPYSLPAPLPCTAGAPSCVSFSRSVHERSKWGCPCIVGFAFHAGSQEIAITWPDRLRTALNLNNIATHISVSGWRKPGLAHANLLSCFFERLLSGSWSCVLCVCSHTLLDGSALGLP